MCSAATRSDREAPRQDLGERSKVRADERAPRPDSREARIVQGRCGLLDVARSSAYYRREPVSEADLCDAAHRRDPSPDGSLRDELEERGHTVNRKRVQRLMPGWAWGPVSTASNERRARGTRSISSGEPGLGMDISYIPKAMAMTWWRSCSAVMAGLEHPFCIEALEEALQSAGDLQYRPGVPGVHRPLRSAWMARWVDIRAVCGVASSTRTWRA